MKKIPKIIMVMLLSVSTLLQITSCQTNRVTENTTQLPQQQKPISNKETETEQEAETQLESETETEKIIVQDSFATIVSFGDTLCHKPLYNAAYDKETGIYDFSSMFKYVEKYFQNSTINIGNCESPMAGSERGYSGYPTFNAPEHLAIDLKELGVDIMTTSNNHTLDKGFSGLSSTLDFLDDAGIAHVGTARTEEEQNTILFMDLNGIKTAFLSYTY